MARLTNQHILVTRPSPQGEQLCEAIQQAGGHAWHQPILSIEPLEITLPDLTHYQAMIFISVSTVKQFFLHQPELPSTVKIFAVGSATSKALNAQGIDLIIAPEIQTSEGLLDLSELKTVQANRILIVRGQGGRETLKTTLEQRGAQVDYLEVYQRTPIPFDAKLCLQNWQDNQIGWVIFSSGESLETFCNQCDPDAMAWLQQCHIVVPSQRIVYLAQSYKLNHIHCAAGASHQAIIEAIADEH